MVRTCCYFIAVRTCIGKIEIAVVKDTVHVFVHEFAREHFNWKAILGYLCVTYREVNSCSNVTATRHLYSVNLPSG